MFASASRSLRSPLTKACGRFSRPTAAAATKQCPRSFSSLPQDDPQSQFIPSPPTALNMDMAIGIQDANQLFLKHGVGQQRLKLLSEDPNMPLVIKWQRMMQIYLGMQLHTVAGLGYQASEQGIMMYTQQLAQFVGTCEPSVQDQFREVGRTTWRDMLKLAFALEDELATGKYDEELGVVDARNASHKVASKMIEPHILEELATKCGQLPSGTL